MKWFWSNYLTNQTNVKDPLVSPLQASIGQLKGLPPALFINGENDVLCDEGKAYALKSYVTDCITPICKMSVILLP
jgi:acetyl esterase